jgi:hypothetical protein
VNGGQTFLSAGVAMGPARASLVAVVVLARFGRGRVLSRAVLAPYRSALVVMASGEHDGAAGLLVRDAAELLSAMRVDIGTAPRIGPAPEDPLVWSLGRLWGWWASLRGNTAAWGSMTWQGVGHRSRALSALRTDV